MQISSPRAPRSSHYRSSSTRTSPRHSPRDDRVHPYGGHRGINQPNYEDQAQPALAPNNLENAGGGFNVDPTAAVLESGGETYQEPVEPASRRRFVGGFVGGLRKALQRNNHREDIAYPEPAVVHDEERQYEPVPRADPEGQMQYAESLPSARYASPSPDPRYAAPEYAPDLRYAADPQYAPDARASSDARHHRQESSSTVSETVHTTPEHYEGTTIVDHTMPTGMPPAAGDGSQFGTPQLVEPQPGPDYAKMPSPPPSEASYIARVQQFFRALNELPWIAPERVTVDYFPGSARRVPDVGPTLRPARGANRHAVISWYNSDLPQASIDLLSSVESARTRAESAQVQARARAAGGGYADNVRVPATAGPPPMAAATREMASRPHRVPVPRLSPELGLEEDQEDREEEGGYYAPRYPNGGYVPYDQQPVAPAYTGSSIASALPSSRRQRAAV
ncbi:hypothetical protein B0H11DRAFT_2270941 [Mycena galericulata]|nr:hypothetical protein B0H11DRAFT_2270941 [Mycena galericulata]